MVELFVTAMMISHHRTVGASYDNIHGRTVGASYELLMPAIIISKLFYHINVLVVSSTEGPFCYIISPSFGHHL